MDARNKCGHDAACGEGAETQRPHGDEARSAVSNRAAAPSPGSLRDPTSPTRGALHKNPQFSTCFCAGEVSAQKTALMPSS